MDGLIRRFYNRVFSYCVAILTVYLMTGGTHPFEHWENSLRTYRIIDELFIDTPVAKELNHAATMLIQKGK